MSLTDEDHKILSERIVKKSDNNYPREAMHIWAENKPVDAHNENMLDSINGELVTIITHDLYPHMSLILTSTKHWKGDAVQMQIWTIRLS